MVEDVHFVLQERKGTCGLLFIKGTKMRMIGSNQGEKCGFINDRGRVNPNDHHREIPKSEKMLKISTGIRR